MLASVFAMQSSGRILAFGIGLAALKIISQIWGLQPDSPPTVVSKLVVDQVWRWTVGIGILPAAVAIVLRYTIPETPRYYNDIMDNLFGAVKNVLKLHKEDKKGRRLKLKKNEPAPSRPNTDETEQRWYLWYSGALHYLTVHEEPWRRLVLVSLLWAVLDISWYGLSIDNPSALSTLAHNPTGNSTSYTLGASRLFIRGSVNDTCRDTALWNTDWWDPANTIYEMLQDDALRSIIIVSTASLVGSLSSIAIINIFHRKSILIVTFLLLSLLFVAAGSSLIVTFDDHEWHVSTTVFYAILQFVFNLGPNTLIFILPAEIFPTVYRGTCYGISAACGKAGAVAVRAVIAATGNGETALGWRFIAFAPLMLLAAVVSFFLPRVQQVLEVKRTHTGLEKNAGTTEEPPADQTATDQNGPTLNPNAETQVVDGVEGRNAETQATSTAAEPVFLSLMIGGDRLTNIALENIAPNPLGKHARSKAAAVVREPENSTHASDRDVGSSTYMSGAN